MKSRNVNVPVMNGIHRNKYVGLDIKMGIIEGYSVTHSTVSPALEISHALSVNQSCKYEYSWVSLKALFNTIFTVKIWAACPYMLSVSLIRCTNEALKKIVLQKQH